MFKFRFAYLPYCIFEYLSAWLTAKDLVVLFNLKKEILPSKWIHHIISKRIPPEYKSQVSLIHFQLLLHWLHILNTRPAINSYPHKNPIAVKILKSPIFFAYQKWNIHQYQSCDSEQIWQLALLFDHLRLIKAKPKISHRSPQDDVIDCILYGSVAQARQLLENKSIQSISETVLETAARSGRIEMIEFILNHPNKSPDATINQFLINSVIASGQIAAFEYLFSRKLPTAKITQGALHYAAAYGHIGIFNHLLTHKDKPAQISITEETLKDAALSGNINMFNFIYYHLQQPPQKSITHYISSFQSLR